mgnify:CR=1 FL=1
MTEQATLPEMLEAIKRLRAEVPEFNPEDAESKEKIEQFHQKLHSLVLCVRDFVGFEDYEQTLKFIDQEIRNMANLEASR